MGVFYFKMKGDYFRYIAEFTEGEGKTGAANSAHQAYNQAMEVATTDLVLTHPIRLGLALNFCVPLRGAREPGGGVQDVAPGLRGRDRGARQRERGLLQGLDVDHAASPGQSDLVDVGRRGSRGLGSIALGRCPPSAPHYGSSGRPFW